MTATQPTSPVCPECGGTTTMVLADGMARCFDDQHEWDPAAVTALARPQRAPEPPHGDPDVLEPPLPETPTLEPFGMASVEDVLGPPPGVAVDTLAAQTDELIGGTARLEGGQVATVLSFPDADHVIVRTNDGRDETVALGDVEHITPRAPAYVISRDDVKFADSRGVSVDEAHAMLNPEPAADPTFEAAMALSGRMVSALSAIIDEHGEGPVVDGAITLTLSRMIIGYEVEIEDLMGGIEQIASVLAEGDQPTEET